MARIGVEYSLQNVQQVLQEKGYDVVNLQKESDVQGCDLCVVTGLDSNVLGVHDTVIEGPVIEAKGLSAEEVCERVEKHLH